MQYIIIFFSAFFLTIFLAPYLIRFLVKYKITDNPGGRRIHDTVTPRMGGLIIIFIVSFFFLIIYNDLNSVRLLLISNILIIICGILDDIRGLNFKVKFISQTFSALFILLHFSPQISTFSFFSFELPYIIGFFISLIFIVGIFNAINMMDGLDGLVSTTSFMLLLVISVIAYGQNNSLILLVSLFALGTVLGFMKFNTYPAKIFLGDTGAFFIASILITSLFDITIKNRSGNLDLVVPSLFLGLPTLDTLKVMIYRINNGAHPFTADKSHLHHLFLSFNIKHRYAVLIIQLLYIPFLILGIAYYRHPSIYYIILLIPLSALTIYSPQLTAFLLKIQKIRMVLNLFQNFLIYILNSVRKIYPFVLLIALILIILTTMPAGSKMDNNYTLIFIVISLLQFILSVYENHNSGNIKHFYVFLNLFFYFLILKTGFFGFAHHSQSAILESKIIFYAALVSIIIFVVIFLLLRDRVIPSDILFFSGIELTVVPLIVLFFIIGNIINYSIIPNVTISFLLAFVFYLAYKIYTAISIKYIRILFYGSYLPTFAYLVLQLI